jgi:hypothetical protein
MTTSLDPAELDNLCFGAPAIWQSAYAYPITTSKVLHEMALIIVHRSPPPIRDLGTSDSAAFRQIKISASFARILREDTTHRFDHPELFPGRCKAAAFEIK